MSKLDKVLNWCKKYWYLLLIGASGVVVVIASIVFRGKAAALVEAFMKNRDGYLEQVDRLNELNKKERDDRDSALKDHLEKDRLLDGEHKAKVFEIEEEKKKRAEEMTNKTSKELADALKDGFDL